MSVLMTHHFLFTTEVTTPLEVDDHSGSALRGALFDAVWTRFCNNKAALNCAECPLHTICPVSALVAPLREENSRGRDIPRPYVILPPLGKARRYEPGQQLLFGITLFGSIVELFPYIVMATQCMEAQGLGRKLRENNLQRGKFQVKYIESYNPMNGQSQIVYQAGKPCVDAPTFSVTASDVAERASALPTDKITLNFLTPTRISLHEKPIHHAAFLPIIQRLLERLTALEQVYGVQEGQSPADNWRDLVQLASEISCLADGTAWEELSSYSSRTKSKSPIGGFQGSATFAGDLTPFRELLVWGELIHVGKNAVKGNGWYKIVG